ncbi:MAG: hypothetical protein ABIH66_05615 [bacterium]
MVFLLAGAGFGADSNLVEALQFTGGDNLIQALIIVSDEELLRYNIIASCDAGVRGIDLLAGPTAIFIQPCGKKQTCRLNGTAPMANLKTNVITARAECSDGTTQKESIKLNIGRKNPKIYIVASLPHISGQVLPPIVSGGRGGSGPGGIVEMPEKGPDLTLETKKEGENTYRVIATAGDSRGIDFLEIMREKVFLDVELCRKKTTCILDKKITEDSKETVAYQFKTMNLDGVFTFDEIVLTFKVGEETREENKGENAGENEETADSTESSATDTP